MLMIFLPSQTVDVTDCSRLLKWHAAILLRCKAALNYPKDQLNEQEPLAQHCARRLWSGSLTSKIPSTKKRDALNSPI